jgi:hypothetical protein
MEPSNFDRATEMIDRISAILSNLIKVGLAVLFIYFISQL